MTMLVNDVITPIEARPALHGFLNLNSRQGAMPNRQQRLESQIAKTLRASERLDRDEAKLKNSAMRVLMAILRYAAATDDSAA
jgi:hypothetical protein